MEGHIYKPFDKELSDLKENLLLLGGLVEKAINRAITALGERNDELAAAVIANDDAVDNQELKIDELCLQILALRQPAARDLRFITTAIKVNYDLERIGDMAVNICERVQELNAEPQLKPYVDLPRMADLAQQMLKQSLSAFVNGNPDLAWQVIKDDEQVDRLHDRIFRELLDYMTRDFNTVTRSTRLLFISKYLERIADHAVNVAELVIFMVQGKIVRHLRDAKGG
jgi:phosphate transport system protein